MRWSALVAGVWLLGVSVAAAQQTLVTRDDRIATGGTVAVRAGDSAWTIARDAGVPLRDLVRANGLRPPYRLRVGQRLRLPQLRLHRVKPGESLSTIAERYGVGRFQLARLNRIDAPWRVFPRQILKIPGTVIAVPPPPDRPVSGQAKAPPPPPPRDVGVASVARPARAVPVPAPPPRRQVATSSPPPPPTRLAAHVPPPPPSRPGTAAAPLRAGIGWPLGGPVLSGYGPKPGGTHNDGVNIAAAEGAAVRAAGDGRVVYAGNEIAGLGNMVLIRHPGGLTTAYAHLARIDVEAGQIVRRGSAIATVGATGKVTRPQLHFQIRQGKKVIDPVARLGPAPTG